MKKYLIIIALALTTFVAKSQDETLIIVNYLPAVSLGETADYTQNFSPRGVDFEVNKFFGEDLSMGFNVGWNIFREKVSNETFDYKDMTITGTQFRYTNVVPLTVNVKKYFSGNSAIPYLGVGAGTTYAKQSADVGVFTLSQDKWLFTMAPEFGILYEMSRSTDLSFKVKYNYSIKAGNFPSMSYVSFGIGIGMK